MAALVLASAPATLVAPSAMLVGVIAALVLGAPIHALGAMQLCMVGMLLAIDLARCQIFHTLVDCGKLPGLRV